MVPRSRAASTSTCSAFDLSIESKLLQHPTRQRSMGVHESSADGAARRPAICLHQLPAEVRAASLRRACWCRGSGAMYAGSSPRLQFSPPVPSAGPADVRGPPRHRLYMRAARLDRSSLAADALQVRTAPLNMHRRQPHACTSCAWDPLHVTGVFRRRSSSRSGARWRWTSLAGCGARSDSPVRPLICCCDA